MYRQILNAAQSFQCSDIVWGLYDCPKQLVESLHELFNSAVVPHQNWFPYESRKDAFDAFLTAAKRSDDVWRNQLAPISSHSPDDDDGNDISSSGVERRRGSSSSTDGVKTEAIVWRKQPA